MWFACWQIFVGTDFADSTGDFADVVLFRSPEENPEKSLSSPHQFQKEFKSREQSMSMSCLSTNQKTFSHEKLVTTKEFIAFKALTNNPKKLTNMHKDFICISY